MADKKLEFTQDEFDKAVQEAVAKSIGKAVSEGIVAAAVATEAARTPRHKVPDYAPNDRCGECRQLVSACKKEHVKVVLQPSQPAPRDFPNPGFTLNGVHYAPRGRLPITVPKAAAEEIKSAIERWSSVAWEIKEGKSRLDNLHWDGSAFETELRSEKF